MASVTFMTEKGHIKSFKSGVGVIDLVHAKIRSDWAKGKGGKGTHQSDGTSYPSSSRARKGNLSECGKLRLCSTIGMNAVPSSYLRDVDELVPVSLRSGKHERMIESISRRVENEGWNQSKKMYQDSLIPHSTIHRPHTKPLRIRNLPPEKPPTVSFDAVEIPLSFR